MKSLFLNLFFFSQVNWNVTLSSYCRVCLALLPLPPLPLMSCSSNHLSSKLHSRSTSTLTTPPSSARNRCHDEWKRKLALHSRVHFLPVQKSMSGLAQDPLPPSRATRFIFTAQWKNCWHPLQVVPFYHHVVSGLTVRCHPDRLTGSRVG